MTVTITNLGGPYTTGDGINNAGQVVGDSTMKSGADHGFLWQNGVMIDLGALSGDSFSSANAVNNQNQVVGVSGPDAFSANHAVLWQNGTVTALTSLQKFSQANDINDLGQVVGAAGPANAADDAFLWQNGVMTDLGTLPGVTTQSFMGFSNSFASVAYAINNASQVVGVSVTAQGYQHAVVWQNGTITDLGGLAAAYDAGAYAINSKGQIVGGSSWTSSLYNTHAVLWQNGTITDLGTLSGDDISAAQGIDSAGDIVGWAGQSTGYGVDHAVLWQNGKAIDLNSLLPANSGWVLTDATAINDQNQIVGSGIDNGITASFLLNLSTANISTGFTAKMALQYFAAGQVVAPTAVSDSAANISANLDALESLATAGKLSSISLTDSGTPSLTVSSTQLSQDAQALNAISGSDNLSASGVASSVANFIVQQDATRLSAGEALDVAGVSSQSGTNSVIGWQSATLPSGHDNVVVLDGAQSQYAVSVAATGATTITDTSTGQATSGQSISVTGESYIIFHGASAATAGIYDQITFVASGGDATVAKLYQSTFGRMPDLPGLEAWQHQFDAGLMTLAQISQSFAGSAEFQSRYGTGTADTQFVDALYTNVLGRTADKGGEAAWSTYLGQQTTATGAAVARATVLLDFATSQEENTNSASWLISPGNGAQANQSVAVVQADSLHVATLIGVSVAHPTAADLA